MSIVFPM